MRRAHALAAACLGVTGLSLASLAHAGDEVASRGAPPLALVELGRRLFFDPAVSRTGMRSCADCHDPHHGWSDANVQSQDVRGTSGRHSQTLINCWAGERVHWDGEFGSIEDLVRARVAAQTAGTPGTAGTPRTVVYYGGLGIAGRPTLPGDGQPPTTLVRVDVGDSEFAMPDARLAAAKRYEEAFRAAFGSAEPTVARITTAISAFCRSIRSGASPYDRWAAGEASALTPSAVRGHALFMGEANCARCHRLPDFTDGKFHDTGIDRVETAGPPAAGKPAATPKPRPRTSYKTPSLRDVARHGPYMHDASRKSLYTVLDHYLSGRVEIRALDERLPTYVARGTDADDLVAFLLSLTSDRRPGEAPADVPFRASRSRLRFVDANGVPQAGREITLEPAGDEFPGADTTWIVRTTDGAGRIEFDFPRTTHVRVRLTPGLEPIGGAWIPDSCREAEIRLPLWGTGRLDVRYPLDHRPPPRIVLFGEDAKAFPDLAWPTTTLTLTGTSTEDGVLVARYAGDVRSDMLGGRWNGRFVFFNRHHVEQVDLSR